MSLGTGLGNLALETAGVLTAIGLLGTVLGLGRKHLPRLAVAAIASLAAALALSELASSAAYLNHDRQASVGARAGMARCVYETAGPRIASFLSWLDTGLPAHASYWLASSPLLADSPGGIDPLCVALELLPRLPLSSPTGAQWIVYTGLLPPAVRAQIANHDPAVKVFSRGYALVRIRAG